MKNHDRGSARGTKTFVVWWNQQGDFGLGGLIGMLDMASDEQGTLQGQAFEVTFDLDAGEAQPETGSWVPRDSGVFRLEIPNEVQSRSTNAQLSGPEETDEDASGLSIPTIPLPGPPGPSPRVEEIF